MKKSVFLWVILCWCVCSGTRGSEKFRQLTLNDGLAHSDATCLAQDSSGLIWIGTNAGLQCYDGYVLQTFDYYPEEQTVFQSHNRIFDMACTGHKLWLGTASGLTCFDLDTRRYVPYHVVSGGKSDFDTDQSYSYVVASLSGQFLWLKTRTFDACMVRVRQDTIQRLDWIDEDARQVARRFKAVCFQEETMWGITDKELYRLTLHGDEVGVMRVGTLRQLADADAVMHDVCYKDGFLYLRVSGGCYRFLVTDGLPVRATRGYVDFHSIHSALPRRSKGPMVVADDGTMWCAYLEGIFGIKYPFSEAPVAQTYLRNARDDQNTAQKITDLLIDSYNNLWVSTNSWGVYYHALSNPLFKNITGADFASLGFARNEIVSVTGGEDDVYMIVEYANLIYYNTQTGQLRVVPLPEDVTQECYLQCVRLSGDRQHLYVGTSQGIFVYDLSKKQIRWLRPVNRPEADRMHTSIADLQEDEAGRLWVATWGRGLFCVDHPLDTPELALYLSTSTSPALLSEQISSICLKGNTVFLCTDNGLNRLECDGKGQVHALSAYQVDAKRGSASLSSNYLAMMDFSNDSVCWIGTIGGGLNKVVLHSKADNDYTATSFTTRDGLSSNDCEIVLIDRTGNVWIGDVGLTQLNLQKKRIYTYDYADGLQNSAFKINVSYKAADGTLFMGGLFGLSSFMPERFEAGAARHTLAWTGLQVNNQQVMPGVPYEGQVVLERNLNETGRLTLNYLQNNFSVSFAALGFRLSEQVMYRYRLKGFRDDWQLLRYTDHQVYFSNLPYGTYELEVQLSTDKGYTWQRPGRMLAIHMLPPWWLSWWARISYALIGVVIALVAFRQYTKEQKLKRENEIQKILIAKDEEKYQAKMQFFMNASHELKTPLTLVQLAAEKLLDEHKSDRQCVSILRNVKKMLVLIAELVDIRKQDLGISTLNLERVNVSELLRQLYADMCGWAENKQIDITCRAEGEDVEMDADRDKVGKMILNLLSNAIKYTGEGGRIEVSFRRGTLQDISPSYPVSHTEGTLPDDVPLCLLKVKDTGVGISSESIRLIYERFFQVNGKTQSHLGSGIGLAIVKSVVLQHKGQIVVSSERNRGSEFIIALPIYQHCAEDALRGNQVLDVSDFIEEQYCELDSADRITSESGQDAGESQEGNSSLPVLLIVEDNKELQQVLKEHFAASYQVILADNGRIGLEKCQQLYPDLIVSDVMMPEMDGIELCHHLKNNLSLASIPFVMLTAKDSVESQIEGYSSGADLYLAKPFSMKLLEVNLRRLIARRDQWLKRDVDAPAALPEGQKADEPLPEGNEVEKLTEEQQRMTEKLKRIIAEHLGESDLSPDFLAKELGVSRTKLYRNIKQIDGFSLSDYLRNVRLEKAAGLLASTDLNVQEVMNEVGFVNSSHFTKIFKLKFGKTPTEYKRGR